MTVSDAEFVDVDCKDKDLNKYCQCSYNEAQDYILKECESILKANLKKLPLFSVSAVQVTTSYEHWPTIPTEYKGV